MKTQTKIHSSKLLRFVCYAIFNNVHKRDESESQPGS